MRILRILLLIFGLTMNGASQTVESPIQETAIPGTRVSLVPPIGFTAAAQFSGFWQESIGSSIMVTEFSGPFSGGLPDDILPGLPDETHISSPNGVTHLTQTFVSGYSLDFSCAHFIPPAFRLGDPQLLDSAKICSLKALDEKIRQAGPRFARQRHRLFN
jgi:hypothetical protein